MQIRKSSSLTLSNKIALMGLVFFTCAFGRAAEDPIFEVAKKGDVTALKQILIERPDAVNARHIGGKETPLHSASMSGKKEAMALLIENKADVQAKDNAGMTPLHYAVLSGNIEAVALLLEHKADPNAKAPPFGITPLQSTKDSKIQELLRKAGAKE